MELERVFVFSDSHFPYHDVGSWAITLRAIRKWKPSVVICLGDLVDCYAISTFPKVVQKPQTLAEEFAPAIRCIRELEKAAPNARYVLCEGNHEARLTRFLQETKALWGMVTLRTLLHLHHWKIIPENQRYKLGKLYFTHGNKSTKYASAAMLERYAGSVFFGHVHRPQMSFKSTIGGEHVSLCPGWLGDPKDQAFDYAPDPDWAHGFATVLIDKHGGNFWWSLNLIINGRVRIDGEVIS